MKLLPLTVCLILLSVPLAHAATCDPPNVARVVEGQGWSANGTIVSAPYTIPTYDLACPAEGVCRYVPVVAPPPPPPTHIVCLTPREAADAVERWR